jgi:pathogenesis-related protein 1
MQRHILTLICCALAVVAIACEASDDTTGVQDAASDTQQTTQDTSPTQEDVSSTDTSGNTTGTSSGVDTSGSSSGSDTSGADTSGSSSGADTSGADTSGSSSGADTSGADTSGGGDTSGSTSGGEDPLGMVAAHNAVRQNVSPAPSTPLPDVSWDASIAAAAQGWADGCVFQHDSNRGPVGENIYVASWQADSGEVVDSWASEVSDYNYANNTCSDVCGHYTQIVWRTSVVIGCAYTDCDSIQGFGNGIGGRLWVCRYSPPGNSGGRPY